MTCNMLPCDRAMGEVPRQGAIVGHQFLTEVKLRACRQTAKLRQGGCHEDKGCLGAVVGFCEMDTARAHVAAPGSVWSRWHRERAWHLKVIGWDGVWWRSTPLFWTYASTPIYTHLRPSPQL